MSPRAFNRSGESDDALRLARAHRRQRLVEQQDARVGEDRARHRDRLPLAARQCADLGLHRGHLDADLGEPCLGAPPHRAVVEEFERPPTQQFAVQKHVVVDAQPVDERQILVDAFDAERPRLVDRAELHRLAINENLPRIRLVVAGQDLDQGRFAGAVVAENTERLAAPDAERHAGECRHGAEHLGDPLGPDRFTRPGHHLVSARKV